MKTLNGLIEYLAFTAAIGICAHYYGMAVAAHALAPVANVCQLLTR